MTTHETSAPGRVLNLATRLLAVLTGSLGAELNYAKHKIETGLAVPHELGRAGLAGFEDASDAEQQ